MVGLGIGACSCSFMMVALSTGNSETITSQCFVITKTPIYTTVFIALSHTLKYGVSFLLSAVINILIIVKLAKRRFSRNLQSTSQTNFAKPAFVLLLSTLIMACVSIENILRIYWLVNSVYTDAQYLDPIHILPASLVLINFTWNIALLFLTSGDYREKVWNFLKSVSLKIKQWFLKWVGHTQQ